MLEIQRLYDYPFVTQKCFLCFNYCDMKNKKLIIFSLFGCLLASCSPSKDSASDINDYENPLNNYEKSLVQKSVIENILDIASIQVSSSSSKDDEKLYGSINSKSISKSQSTSSKITALYKNKIIIENETVTSSVFENQIWITESYDTRNMIAVLENPSDMLTSGRLTTKYGLYKKSFYKASGAKEFGVTYSLVNGNFADESDLDYKWNTYLITNFNKFSSYAFSYFKNDEGTINALYSSLSKSTVTNPLYRNDSAKSVTALTSDVSKLALETLDNGYRIKSLRTNKTVDYLTDFYGNSLEDGNVSSYNEDTSYFYGQTLFAGVPFEAKEYWQLNSATPVLEIYNDGVLSDKTTFTNITRDYQQTYGNDNFAFELAYKPKGDNYTYRLSNSAGSDFYSPSSFNMPSDIGLTTLDDGYFSLDANSTYYFSVVLKPDFTIKEISLSLN